MEINEKKDSFHYLLWYFIIFSFIGVLIETLYCYITSGIIESRKGLIIGPFCPIYGVGAAFMIWVLDKYKDSDLKVFIVGGIAGAIIEYVLSYILEAIYGARFWDYNDYQFNLNGRIALIYTIYWGLLAVILMKHIKNNIDKIIEKIPLNKRNMINILLIIFFIFDVIITIWGVSVYQARVENEYYGIPIEKKDDLKSAIEENCFSNDIIKTIFPNLRTRDKDGNPVFVRDLITSKENVTNQENQIV